MLLPLVEIPGWVGLLISGLSLLQIGQWLLLWYGRKFPTRQEQVDLVKTYTDGKYVEFQLNDQLKKMVQAETEKFSIILLDEKIEHKKQIDSYLAKIVQLEKRLADAEAAEERQRKIYEDKIEILENKVAELEKTLSSVQ